MTTFNFNELTNTCKNIAKELETMVEVKDYPEYGWGCIVFMTDAFGGDYLILHHDHMTGILTDMYGNSSSQIIDSIEQLEETARTNMEKELASRDLEYISDCINSQY